MLLATPKTLKQRALKIWNSGFLHRAWLQKINQFPLEIPLKNISAKTLLNHFSEIQDIIFTLRQDSQKQGYIITDKAISHRQLGEQNIPAIISFETEFHFLNYLAKTNEFEQFRELTELSLQQESLLLDWLIQYPSKVMQYADVWPQLLAVCRHFKMHPHPNCYIRQLDIKTVDSKFIEQHKSILNELLTLILNETDYYLEVKGLKNHGFERRYGLRYDQPLIRFRILDISLAINGLTDLTLTLSEFESLDIAVSTIFIVENKINGLAFPDYPGAMVIFGLGYAVNLLAEVRCLQQRDLFYWGDIDTNGYAILSQFRQYFPLVKSVLMDATTLQEFDHLCVLEPKESSKQCVLSYLTDAENILYQQLQVSLKRLEQERISYSYVQQQLLYLSLD